jgi:predicted O-methyltransferase YrrM
MSVLGSIATLLPPSARNFAIRIRDQWRLSRAGRESCDTAGLGRVDQAWLTQTFRSPTVEAEWPAVAEEIGGFQITTSASGVNPGDRRALYYLSRALRPARVLEVGTHIGASTVHIAAALRANDSDRDAAKGTVSDAGVPGRDAGATLTTVDIQDVNDLGTRPWIHCGSRHAPAEMIARMGVAAGVKFVTQPSLAYLAAPGERFDLIFLDGDHSAATVYRELPAALRRLRPGGLVLLHDYFPDGAPLWPGEAAIAGPGLGVDRLRREGAGLEVLPLGELPWPTKLGAKVTSLALVSRAA